MKAIQAAERAADFHWPVCCVVQTSTIYCLLVLKLRIASVAVCVSTCPASYFFQTTCGRAARAAQSRSGLFPAVKKSRLGDQSVFNFPARQNGSIKPWFEQRWPSALLSISRFRHGAGVMALRDASVDPGPDRVR